MLRYNQRCFSERGSEVLEFAIVMPAFLFIILLGLTYGKVVYALYSVKLAAREAARTYAISYNTQLSADEVQVNARESAANNLRGILPSGNTYFDPASDVAFEEGDTGTNGFVAGSGDYIQATVKARVPIETPWFRRIIGTSANAENNEAFGTKSGDEYVKEIVGKAVFHKEQFLEGSS